MKMLLFSPLDVERVYIPLYKMEDTPSQSQKHNMLI